jgi:hypothetical protein
MKKEVVLNKKRNLFIKNHDYFDIINTETKAYLLGFFIADGYLDNKRVRIQNSIDDLEIIELFRKELTPDTTICYTNKQTGAKFRKIQCATGLTSVHMIKTFKEKYDIVSNKTQNSEFKFDFNTIPKEFHRDFIRGYFDGDGSVSFHSNNFNTIFFNFSFVFNSLNFTNQIANIFENLFQIKPIVYKTEGKTSTWFALRFDYKRRRAFKIKEIYDYLYKDSTIYLNRKKIKFEQYIEYRANPRRKEDRVV